MHNTLVGCCCSSLLCSDRLHGKALPCGVQRAAATKRGSLSCSWSIHSVCSRLSTTSSSPKPTRNSLSRFFLSPSVYRHSHESAVQRRGSSRNSERLCRLYLLDPRVREDDDAGLNGMRAYSSRMSRIGLRRTLVSNGNSVLSSAAVMMSPKTSKI